MYNTSFVLLSAQAPACAFSVGIFVPHNRLLLSFVGSDGRSIWWSFGRTVGVVGLLQQDLNLSKWVVLSEFNEWNGTMLNYRSNEVIIAKCNTIYHREKDQGKWNGNQWIGILPWLSGQDDHYSHLSCRQWMSESLFNERSEVEVIVIFYVWAVQNNWLIEVWYLLSSVANPLVFRISEMVTTVVMAERNRNSVK